MAGLSSQGQGVLLKVYIGQNVNRSGILQTEVKENEQTQILLEQGLIKENHWHLDQFLTTEKGSEIAKALVRARIEKNQGQLQTLLQEIPNRVLGFFAKRHISRKLRFKAIKSRYILIHSWENYVLANGRIWISWDRFFTSLASTGLCVRTVDYVSTRGGETRDPYYVISPEVQDYLINKYAVPDFTPRQEEIIKLYPILLAASRALDADDIDFARQQYYQLLKSHSVTENQLAGIVNDMNKKQITSEYRGLLSEDKPFDIRDFGRYQIYLDKNLIDPAVNILLEREGKIKEYTTEERIPSLSEVKAELGILDMEEQSEFYILVSSFERQLRDFIKKKLGKGWIKRIESDIPNIIENWKKIAKRDRRWGIEPEKELMNYADLGDYILIVKKYKRMFADDDIDLGNIITELQIWYNHGRNPIMHSRTVDRQKYFTTKSAIEFLTQWISRKSV